MAVEPVVFRVSLMVAEDSAGELWPDAYAVALDEEVEVFACPEVVVHLEFRVGVLESPSEERPPRELQLEFLKDVSAYKCASESDYADFEEVVVCDVFLHFCVIDDVEADVPSV